MKFLNDLGVKHLLWDKWGQIIERIEETFLDDSARMVPKIYLDGDDGDFRAMPAAFKKYACLKWIGVFPNNYQVSLPTTLGTLLLNDRETGKPLIAMDCTTLTAFRTAATSAIAAKYCAPDAEDFAFIGCGLQAKYHIEAYEYIFSHMKMSVELHDRNKKAMKQLHGWIGDQHLAHAWGYNETVKEAVKYADVITTLTPSREAYLDINDLRNNCHINAVGADAVGKRELMTNVIDGAADVFCDDVEQALHSGELQYNEWPYLNITNISDLIKNNKIMQLNKGVSVFDSTGVALEDIALAILVYELHENLNG